MTNQKSLNIVSGTQALSVNGTYLELFDIKALLEGLQSEGQELNVAKARLIIELFQYPNPTSPKSAVINPIFLVSDGAIATGDGASAQTVVDSILDAIAAIAGNFEFRNLGQANLLKTKALAYNSATPGVLAQLALNLDITTALRKASQKLIHSAVLATDPEISVGVVALPNIGFTMNYSATVIIEFTKRMRPARMI